MTRKQEGQRQIQKPRQRQGQKSQEQYINIFCFSCSSLFYRTTRETNREVNGIVERAEVCWSAGT